MKEKIVVMFYEDLVFYVINVVKFIIDSFSVFEK